MKLIIAPHPDDEVIGCSRLLYSKTKVIFTEPKSWTDRRKKEAYAISKTFSHTIITPWNRYRWLQGQMIEEMWKTQGRSLCIFAPDPVFETHPDHIDAGSLVRMLSKQMDFRFFTYTTNMRAPYTRELTITERDRKEKMLSFYKSQSDLWKYDHRYFLFEGIVEWNPPVV